MGFSQVERLTDRREKEACKRRLFVSSFLFFLQITIIKILSRDLVSLHKRLIVRASCLQNRFVYSFLQAVHSNRVRDFEGAKDNVLIKGEYVYAAVFVSPKSVISHNNTAHPLLGQNKTKQNKTNKESKTQHQHSQLQKVDILRTLSLKSSFAHVYITLSGNQC